MDANLRFNLPDDEEELRLALDGPNMSSALAWLDEHLRQKIKYGELPQEQQDLLESLRSDLRETLDNYGIKLL